MNPYQTILKKNRKILTGTILLTVLSSLFMVFAGYSLSFFFCGAASPFSHNG